MTWHDMTPHHITWHNMSQLATLPHFTSPHDQAHYFISGTTNHTTSHTTSPHITSPPPTHHGNTTSQHQNATTRQNAWTLGRTKHSVWALHCWVAWRTFYRQILSLVYSLFLPETSAPGSPGNYCYKRNGFPAMNFIGFIGAFWARSSKDSVRTLEWFNDVIFGAPKKHDYETVQKVHNFWSRFSLGGFPSYPSNKRIRKSQGGFFCKITPV